MKEKWPIWWTTWRQNERHDWQTNSQTNSKTNGLTKKWQTDRPTWSKMTNLKVKWPTWRQNDRHDQQIDSQNNSKTDRLTNKWPTGQLTWRQNNQHEGKITSMKAFSSCLNQLCLCWLFAVGLFSMKAFSTRPYLNDYSSILQVMNTSSDLWVRCINLHKQPLVQSLQAQLKYFYF